MNYRELPWHEHRPVRVLLEDGRQVDGWLEAWRKDPDGWRGWVRHSTGVGETYVGWFGEDQLTPTVGRASGHRRSDGDLSAAPVALSSSDRVWR